MNLNIYRDRGQKPSLKGFINNPVLGPILIEFNFPQQDQGLGKKTISIHDQSKYNRNLIDYIF